MAWFYLKHGSDQRHKYSTVVKTVLHKVETFSNPFFIDVECFVIVEVCDDVIASGTDCGDSKREHFVSLIMFVSKLVLAVC